MSLEAWVFLVAVGALVTALAAVAIRAKRRSARSSECDWENLLERLTAIDRSSIAEVALDIVDGAGEPRSDEASAVLEPEQIWRLVGGMDGLEILKANCVVLIDLAFYLQQWYPESLAVAEDLRMSAREIEWHVDRLKSARRNGKLDSAVPMYAQQAAAVYYRMTRELLALYAHGSDTMLARLEAAL